MAVKVKGTPAGIKQLLSGGGSGALVNGGAAPSRESRNKVKVDRVPSAAPKRPSAGAVLSKRAPKPNALTGSRMTELAEPQSFGQPFNM